MKYNLICKLSKSPGVVIAEKKFSFKPLIGNPRFNEFNHFEFTTVIKDRAGKVVDSIKAQAEALVQFQIDNQTGDFSGGCPEHGTYSLSSTQKDVSAQIKNSNNIYGTELVLVMSKTIHVPNINQVMPDKSYKLSCEISE